MSRTFLAYWALIFAVIVVISLGWRMREQRCSNIQASQAVRGVSLENYGSIRVIKGPMTAEDFAQLQAFCR